MRYYLAVYFISIAISLKSSDGRWFWKPQSKADIMHFDDQFDGYNEDLKARVPTSQALAYPMLQLEGTNYTMEQNIQPQQSVVSNKNTIGDAVFNVHHFTQFTFDGHQIYVYSPKKNDENILEPQKWAFFYVPVLQPIKPSSNVDWTWTYKNEVRMRLALGTPEVEAAARKAISNQYDQQIASNYSHLWVVAPLMLNSLSAYIVTAGSSLVEGVAPFHIDNPNSNEIIFRFVCKDVELSRKITSSIMDGDYDVEVALYFAGMHNVKTNMVSITATQLQSVLSKTIADGGGTNSTYIHRDQASSFVSIYVANVKKLIYVEDPNVNMSLLTNGLEEQFRALFQEGISQAKESQINANAFGQVWQSSDLNPDRITSEMSKIFTFNQSETNRHNNSQHYYSVNQRKDSSLSVHAALDVRVKTIFTKVDVHAEVDYKKTDSEGYQSTSQSAVSQSDIAKAMSQNSVEGSWEGEKFVPKSFKVFKLNDVVDHLQVAVISKQLSAERATGAVIRKVSTLATPTGSMSLLTGEIKLYAGSSPPLHPWLLCDGSIVSRSQYPRLFSVIGTTFGVGYDPQTFRLPDLRGRVPIGVDAEQLRVDNASAIGAEGGVSNHTLTVDELPSHTHSHGDLQNSHDGSHTHGIYDPGHNHGGHTNQFSAPSPYANDHGEYYYRTTGSREWQSYTISTDYTRISIYANGNHTHTITGSTGSVGYDRSFVTVPPFQAFHYIIYAGE